MKKTKEQLKSEINAKLKEYFELFLNKKREDLCASGKTYDENEIISITDAALDGWWTEGVKTKKFEQRFNNFLGVKDTIVVNSGSSANLLALKALASIKLGENRLKEGDEVITVAAGFPTTVNPIIQCNCTPVFCDIDIGTYNINIKQMKEAVSEKTRAIFLAHTLGNPFNVKEVLALCKKHGLWLIEDNCDALGSKYEGRYTGTFGDISTFSFYPAHHITMGEGGAVCSNNPNLAKIARSIRDWGRDCCCGTGQDNLCGKRYEWKLGDLPYGYDHKYIYSETGYNLKNTDLHVSIGLAQMDKLNGFIQTRKRNFDLLYKGMQQFRDKFYLPEAEKNSEPSWFGFLITLKEECNFKREELLKYLNNNKIGTRLLFGGNITKQPYFIDNKIKYMVVEKLMNTDTVMTNTFWVGVHPGLTKKMIGNILEKFDNFIRRH